ncbi:MAG: ParB/RepB/Spo0J family partition protein [Rubrobacteraceae bacterium]
MTNTLRIVQLPERIRTLLQDGKLTEGHARALLGLQTENQMEYLAGRIQREKLSVRRTEELVREILSGEQKEREIPRQEENNDEYEQASRMITEAIELPVKVKRSRHGGKIEIRFRQREELEALVELLTSK